eukprot:GGOE01005370.1.p1 GENE.GGOE01005370.1~~GGOE01005370.1.p1  ORF type:complete len:483 (-),score=65.48 GGOE01005370.1:690-1967(-)
MAAQHRKKGNRAKSDPPFETAGSDFPLGTPATADSGGLLTDPRAGTLWMPAFPRASRERLKLPRMQNYKKVKGHHHDSGSFGDPASLIPDPLERTLDCGAETPGQDASTPTTTLSRVTKITPRPDTIAERAVFTPGKSSTGNSVSLSCSWPSSTPQHRFQSETPQRVMPRYFHRRGDFPLPSGGHEGFKLEHTILMRVLHVCDLGDPPTRSQLLEMMETGRIPEMFHTIIAKNAPGESFEEIRTAVVTGKPTTTHLYRELVTDTSNSEVTVKANWESSPHELRAFTRGNGPLSDPDMAELMSILPDLWTIRGRTDEEKRRDQEYASLLKNLTRRKPPAAGEPLRISDKELPSPPRRLSAKLFATQVPELPELSDTPSSAQFGAPFTSVLHGSTAAPPNDTPVSALPPPSFPQRSVLTLSHFLTPL